MIRLLTLIISIASITLVNAQNINCGSTINREEVQLYKEKLKEVKSSRKNLRTSAAISYIPVVIHIVRRTRLSDDTIKYVRKPVKEAEIIENLLGLNELFVNSNIELYIEDINYISSDRYFDLHLSEEESPLGSQYDRPNVVNLYFVNRILLFPPSTYADGYAHYPPGDDRIFVVSASPSLLAHEFGHYFGLLHTFEGNETADMNSRELVKRTNCEYTGDYMCSTPADPYPFVPTVNYKNCVYYGDARDANGDQYKPALDNIMSYYNHCGLNFTDEQYQLMDEINIALRRDLRPEARGNINPGRGDDLTDVLKVFPNPVKDNIILRLPAESQQTTIELRNSNGLIVLENTEYRSGIVTIPATHLPVGLYLLTVGQGISKVKKKVVIY